MHDREAPSAADLGIASGGRAALRKVTVRKKASSALPIATYQVIANKNLAFSK